jgi:DNA-binding CsgD family transcriptional regulator
MFYYNHNRWKRASQHSKACSSQKGIVARKHFFQRLWERIQRALHQETHPGRSRSYRLDTRQVKNLHRLAQAEQRPFQDVANDLLVSEMVQHWVWQDLWRCWQSLTPREKDVTALICLGYTSNQVAARLYITPSTVKTHARNALAKFAMENRNELRRALAEWDFSQWETPTPGD